MHADPTRPGGAAAVPLTALSQVTRATIADPGSIEHAQALIRFSTLFGGRKLRSGGTAQGAIRLERKVSARETALFPVLTRFCRSIALCGGRSVGRLGGYRGESWRKLGGPHWLRLELVAQLQAQIPDPLGNDLPALLPPGSMRAPTVGILFLILVREGRFKRAAMEVERHDICSGESPWWQRRQKQFIDHACTGAAHPTLQLARWMGCHHDPARLPFGAEGQQRTIIEGAGDAAFRMGHLLIGRQVQAGLDFVPVEQVIVLAPRHIREARQIGQDRSGAILSIQAHHGPRLSGTGGA